MRLPTELNAARVLALAATMLASSSMAAQPPSVWTRPVVPGRYAGPWEVAVKSDVDADLRVFDSDGKLVAGPFAANNFTVIDPSPWSDENPAWYRLVAERDGETTESVFGFTEMRIGDDGLFRVNGRVVRLKPGPKELNGNAALASDDLTGENAWKRGVYRLTEQHLKMLSPSSIVHVAIDRPETMSYAFRDWSVKGTNYNQRFVVSNRNSFRDASDVTCRWHLLVDGKEVDDGKIDLFALEPGCEAAFDMPHEVTDARLKEGTVSVRFTFERDGKTVSTDQIDLVASREANTLQPEEGWFSAHLVPEFMKSSVECEIKTDDDGRKTREFTTSRTIFTSGEKGDPSITFARRGRLWGAKPLVTGIALEEGAGPVAFDESASPVEQHNGVFTFTTPLHSKNCDGTARWTIYPFGIVACRAWLRSSEPGKSRIILLLSDDFGEEKELEWFGRGPFATGNGAFSTPLPPDGAFLGRWNTEVELSAATRSSHTGSTPFFSATDVRGLRFGDLTVRTLGAPFAFCARVCKIGDVPRPALILETGAVNPGGTSEIAFTLSIDDDNLTARMPDDALYEECIQ